MNTMMLKRHNGWRHGFRHPGAPLRWRPLIRMIRRTVWSPVPWMLETGMVLLIALRDTVGVLTMLSLLALNAVLSLFRDGNARG